MCEVMIFFVFVVSMINVRLILECFNNGIMSFVVFSVVMVVDFREMCRIVVMSYVKMIGDNVVFLNKFVM